MQQQNQSPQATTTPSSESSPLAEANPGSLDEFFSKDPEQLTQSDLEVLCTKLRAQREEWLKAEAGGARRAKPSKGSPVPGGGKNFNPEDLGL